MMKQLAAFLFFLLFGSTQIGPLLSQVFHNRVEYTSNEKQYVYSFPKKQIKSVVDLLLDEDLKKCKESVILFYFSPQIIELGESFILGGIGDIVDKAYKLDGKPEVEKEITYIEKSGNLNYSAGDLENFLEKLGKGKQIFDDLIAKEEEIRVRAAWEGKKLDDNEIVKQTLVEYGLEKLFTYSDPGVVEARKYEKQMKEQAKLSLEEFIRNLKEKHEIRWKADIEGEMRLIFTKELKTKNNSELWEIVYEGQLPSNFAFDFLYSKKIASSVDTYALYMDAASYEYLTRMHERALQIANKKNWDFSKKDNEMKELSAFFVLNYHVLLNMAILESLYGEKNKGSQEAYQLIKDLKIIKVGGNYVVRPQDRDKVFEMHDKIISNLKIGSKRGDIMKYGVKNLIIHNIVNTKNSKFKRQMIVYKNNIEKHLSEFNSQ